MTSPGRLPAQPRPPDPSLNPCGCAPSLSSDREDFTLSPLTAAPDPSSLLTTLAINARCWPPVPLELCEPTNTPIFTTYTLHTTIPSNARRPHFILRLRRYISPDRRSPWHSLASKPSITAPKTFPTKSLKISPTSVLATSEKKTNNGKRTNVTGTIRPQTRATPLHPATVTLVLRVVVTDVLDVEAI